MGLYGNLSQGAKKVIFTACHLWLAICFKIMTRYTCGFCPRILAIIPATRYTCVFLSRLLAFYSQVYDHFLTNAHIYAHKKPIYLRYKQACGQQKKPFMYDGAEK